MGLSASPNDRGATARPLDIFRTLVPSGVGMVRLRWRAVSTWARSSTRMRGEEGSAPLLRKRLHAPASGLFTPRREGAREWARLEVLLSSAS